MPSPHHNHLKTASLLILHLATITNSQALVKHDLAMWGEQGAKLDDCFWSATHENKLAGRYVREFKWHDRIPICQNGYSSGCRTDLAAKWVPTGRCVARIDLYYEQGHEPDTVMSFFGTKGYGLWYPFGQNAGGELDGMSSCDCREVGVRISCSE